MTPNITSTTLHYKYNRRRTTLLSPQPREFPNSPSGMITSYRYYLNVAGPNKTPVFVYPGLSTSAAVNPFENNEILTQLPTALRAKCGSDCTNGPAVDAEFGASISCADVDNDGDTGENTFETTSMPLMPLTLNLPQIASCPSPSLMRFTIPTVPRCPSWSTPCETGSRQRPSTAKLTSVTPLAMGVVAGIRSNQLARALPQKLPSRDS